MADFDDINAILKDLLLSIRSEEQLTKLGLQAQFQIKDRTRKGIDVEGRPFQPYSEKYRKFRQAIGLPVDVVNLQLNDIDGMLRKIDHEIANDLESVSVDIDDPRKREIASYHNELGVAKRGENIRHFWDLNREEREEIAGIVEKDLEQLLANLTRVRN